MASGMINTMNNTRKRKTKNMVTTGCSFLVGALCPTCTCPGVLLSVRGSGKCSYVRSVADGQRTCLHPHRVNVRVKKTAHTWAGAPAAGNTLPNTHGTPDQPIEVGIACRPSYLTPRARQPSRSRQGALAGPVT